MNNDITETQSLKRKQFKTIFLIEIWERFAFYSFNGLFVLYASSTFFSESKSYLIFGIFMALAYGFPAVGGLIADRLLGIKRTLILGVFLLIAGYICLATAASYHFVIFAMALITVGNGFFKPNPSSLIGIIFKSNPSESDAAFTMYYMAINIGGLIATLFCPIIAQRFSFNLVFWIAMIGMIFALSNYFLRRKLFHNTNNIKDQESLTLKKVMISCTVIVTLIIISSLMLHFSDISFIIILATTVICYSFLFFNSFSYADKIAKFKQIVGVLLFVQAIVYFIIYTQMFSTIVLFAKHNVDLNIFGLKLSPASFQAFNNIWILVLSPILAIIYVKMEKAGIKNYLFDKFAISMFCCVLGFIVLLIGCKYFTTLSHISGGWLVVYYFFGSLSELLTSALGLSVASQFFPQNKISFCMGAWLMAQGCGNALAGKIASGISVSNSMPSTETLTIYINYFYEIFLVCIIAFVIFMLIAFCLRFLGKKNKIKFA